MPLFFGLFCRVVTRSADQLDARLNWRRVPRQHQDIATGPTVM